MSYIHGEKGLICMRCEESFDREVIEPSSELGDVDALNRKIKTVLNYIKTSEGNLTQHMWAATIIAVLLECDFRDSKQKLDEWYEETK